MNSFILELSSLENKVLNNENSEYCKEIHKSLLEFIEEKKEENLKISIIGEIFLKQKIEIVKGDKYRIRVVIKNEKTFSKISRKLFEIAIEKQNLRLGEISYLLIKIFTSDKIWCGEYNIIKELSDLEKKKDEFEKTIEMTISNPIIENGKSIFGFNKILGLILNEMYKEKLVNDIDILKSNIENSIIIKEERYKEIRKNILGGLTDKIYLGKVKIILKQEYGKLLEVLLKYIKFSGIGEYKEIGFGEIGLREWESR